ncbi:MAG TPA: ATP-binding protein, partial [Gemmatimonadaceae bacterium]|nr:ATP-binding protein [Gemmatimonadaceae bacterium]
MTSAASPRRGAAHTDTPNRARDIGDVAAGYAHGWAELEGHLARLHLVLRRAVDRVRRRSGPQEATGLDGVVILDREVDDFLEAPLAEWISGASGRGPRTLLPASPFDPLIAEQSRRIAVESETAARRGVPLPLRILSVAFGLSPLELDLCMLALAPDLHAGYGRVIAYLHNDVLRTRPSIAVALELYGSGWSDRLAVQRVLTPDAPLLRQRLLIRRSSGEGGLGDTLLMDATLVDRLLSPANEHENRPSHGLPLLPAATAERAHAVSVWLEHAARLAGRPPLVCLSGPDGSGKRALAGWLAERAGGRASFFSLDPAQAGGVLTERLLGWLRDARLNGEWPCVDGSMMPEETATDSLLEAAREMTARGFAAGFVVSERPFNPPALLDAAEVAQLELTSPSVALREQAWRRFLADEGITSDNADIRDVAAVAPLTVGHVQRASRAVATSWRLAGRPESGVSGAQLRAACRSLVSHRLDRLADRVALAHDWDDLVLPADATHQLHDIADAVRQRHQVLEHWDFGRKVSVASGISALFAGPPGTGKTMAAGVLAAELGMELYRVDLSRVVSKYIGETEKHLDALFAESRRAHAILLFDEADALFGKRSEVKDAHDRYANLEVAFLLQRMESSEGIFLLATNLRGNMDRAFVRRLQFAVDFPPPSEALRLRIWQRVWPRAAQLAPDLDLA